MVYRGCECEECKRLPLGLGHTSDCALHSEPAEPKGECNCGALEILRIKDEWGSSWTDHAPYYIETLLNWIFGDDSPSDNKCENGTKVPDGGCFGCNESDLCA